VFLLNLILTILLLTGVGYVLYLIKKNRALADINNLISRELGVLIEAAAKVAKKLPRKMSASGPAGELLEDPALLATILTAMVIKYGDMKIGMTDFDSIGKEDYISVYIDTAANELLLSINPDLAANADAAGAFGFYPPVDDNTFH
jgi:multisubunit Na+/H+ antiporter MnhC subunit